MRHPLAQLALALPLATLLLAATPSRGAEPAAPAAEAQAAFQAKDWAKAAAAFEKVVAATPDDAQAWFSLGISRRQLKHYDQAIAALEQAQAKGYPAPTVTTSLAVTYSLAGDLDRAFEKLEQAVKLGVPSAVIDSHPGLVAVRADSRYKAFAEKADKIAHPCENDPRYRAFDFWVGDWEAWSGGQKVGENRIEKILRGCVLLENWSGGGSSGKSFNYFDATDAKWHQNWVDEGGGIVTYEGEVRDGVMHYTGENRPTSGPRLPARVTFTPLPAGGVHHLIETSTDGGKTWTVSNDITYLKRGEGPPK